VKLTPKLSNALRYYTLSINESEQLAETEALKFEEKFLNLNKWMQVQVSMLMETGEFEEAFLVIDRE
jgi:hypothetical protein